MLSRNLQSTWHSERWFCFCKGWSDLSTSLSRRFGFISFWGSNTFCKSWPIVRSRWSSTLCSFHHRIYKGMHPVIQFSPFEVNEDGILKFDSENGLLIANIRMFSLIHWSLCLNGNRFAFLNLTLVFHNFLSGDNHMIQQRPLINFLSRIFPERKLTSRDWTLMYGFAFSKPWFWLLQTLN